jgi:hypothetical protein
MKNLDVFSDTGVSIQDLTCAGRQFIT